MSWPPITLEDAQAIRDHVDAVDIVGAEIWDFGFKAAYRGKETNDNISICGGTPEYPQNDTHYIGRGRNISQMDVHAGRKVIVIGYAIAQRLFPFVDPSAGRCASTAANTRSSASSTRRNPRSTPRTTAMC